jgi:hypothetical protein
MSLNHCSIDLCMSLTLPPSQIWRIDSEIEGKHCDKSRKVASWVLDEIIGPNHSSRTMALGSIQPLTEMSTRNPLRR